VQGVSFSQLAEFIARISDLTYSSTSPLRLASINIRHSSSHEIPWPCQLLRRLSKVKKLRHDPNSGMIGQFMQAEGVNRPATIIKVF